jgi:hypothetical protein
MRTKMKLRPKTAIKTMLFAASFIILSALSGCGSNADNLMKKEIGEMSELAAAIENDEPEATVQEIRKRRRDTAKALDDWKANVSVDEIKKLKDKNNEEWTKAANRLFMAEASLKSRAVADSLVKDLLKSMDDLAVAIEKKEPQNKVNEIRKEMKGAAKKLDDLRLREEAQMRLVEKHKDEFSRVNQRLQALGVQVPDMAVFQTDKTKKGKTE